MKNLLLNISLLLSVLTFSLPALSQDCDYLNEIATRCISRRLPDSILAKVPHCGIGNTPKDSLIVKARFVEWIITDEDFLEQVILMMRFHILKGVAFNDVYKQMEEFDVLSMMLPLAMNDAEEKAMYSAEYIRLYEVYQLSDNLISDSIDFEDMYKILFNNFFYDGQNMGDDNFINSTFQYSMGRSPTEKEHKSGIAMINDQESYLFFKKGSTKRDYLNIITSNKNFYEFQVKYWYYYFLMDYPEQEEIQKIIDGINEYNVDINIENIIKYILIYKIV